MDGTLPQNPGACLIVSTKKPSFECIGETNNVARRIEQHDSLRGPRVTAQPDLVPFAMHACVVGFNDKTERLRFEAEWKLNNQQRRNMPLTNDGCVDVGINMIAEKNLNGRLQGVPPL
jgi:predicted GIY-YIG superfamily endonuclease